MTERMSDVDLIATARFWAPAHDVDRTIILDLADALERHFTEAWVDEKLRDLHQVEIFGDCVECGQKFPCRTVLVLETVTRHNDSGSAPDESSSLLRPSDVTNEDTK